MVHRETASSQLLFQSTTRCRPAYGQIRRYGVNIVQVNPITIGTWLGSVSKGIQVHYRYTVRLHCGYRHDTCIDGLVAPLLLENFRKYPE